MPAVRIGISGWTYAPWRGTFFPDDLPQRRELAYAAERLSTIEINGTFYSLQRADSFARWHDDTPKGFVFSVKGSRYITHLRRLKEPDAALANFFASGVLRLREKLGPFLWQLPPSFRYDRERLESFFAALPGDTLAAAKLARRHDARVRHASVPSGPRRRLRHVIEVRHASFCQPEFVALLRRHRIGLVVADTAGKWPFMEDVTADLVYVRLHGGEELYTSGYGSAALAKWAKKIRAWHRGVDAPAARLTGPPTKWRARGRDVFVYFDNDVKVRAPYDAMRLAWLLNGGPEPPRPPSARRIAEVARTKAPPVRRSRRKP
ncbi:MAG TPA: DUF72 domain-containing protein [Lacunisphaera sp.]|jgi:uncharacterized protein YecE (DUF72 family)|nr:DUF72 domain-containing protein [Lacunisphaera sp.]